MSRSWRRDTEAGPELLVGLGVRGIREQVWTKLETRRAAGADPDIRGN